MSVKVEYLLCILSIISVTTIAFPSDKSSLITSTVPPENNSNHLNNTQALTSEEKSPTVPVIPKIYEMRVNTNVSNRFATTSIISKVKNLAKKAHEATFSVVLPEKAYITGFVMEIDGKKYEAYVKEKEEAKQIYSQAVQQGQAAAHVEVNARDSNRFTVSVNVEPQKKAVFTLTYEELLKRQNEQYEIILNIHPGQPVKDLSVEVNINESRPLKFVKSPPLRSGNDISKIDDDKLASKAEINIVNSTSAKIKFNPSTERQKQLASGLGTEEENGLAGQFVVQYDVERDPHGGEVLLKDGYFVHFFAPSELPNLPKHVVFVLDTSGSMGGIRIQQLKEAMNSILGELKEEDLLNIVEFNSVVKVWNIDKVEVDYQEGNDPWPVFNVNTSPQPETSKENKTSQNLPPPFTASEEHIKKAKQVVEKLVANGGTDIKTGLEVGLKLVKKNKKDTNSTHQPIIIFLTDGEPTVGETFPDKIISTITELNSGSSESPIFSLSFGDFADRNFLQKLSLKNHGFARHIYEAADATLQLQEFYKQISSPLLSNVLFKYTSEVKNLTKTQFPIFFRGSEIVVAGVTDEGFVPPHIEGLGLRGPIDWIPKVEAPIGDLERLWAYLTIKQILDDREAVEDKKPLTDKALAIALKYSFVTPVSSLVVVKPNETSSAVDTQDASKTAAAGPQLGYNNFAVGGVGAAGFGGGVAGFGGTVPPLAPAAATGFAYRPQPVLGLASGAVAALGSLSTTSVPQLVQEEPIAPSFQPYTTEATIVTTVLPSPYENITNTLPWLKDILSENGTVTIKSGNYKLTDNAVSTKPECPETPINGTAGVCTPLLNCPEVFDHLSDVHVFEKYFCPLEITFAGICCPKATDIKI